MSKEVYATLDCKNCGSSWDITFDNTNEHPVDYAMAIEQKLDEPCPDCGKVKLKLRKEQL